MPNKPEFSLIHARLKRILEKYAGTPLQAQTDNQDNYELIGPPTERSQGKAVWFGAVRTGKRYVSYHLMAIYAFPDLLDGISPELKKRMQGKSCFNFTALNEQLFVELERLTDESYNCFKNKKFID
jgi:hypothetical protein